MAGPKTFVGVGGKAKQVKNIYVGVSGKARKVKKAYVGVSGKARLVYSSDFWLPTGVAASNCLAAYRFKGAASESAALTDLTGHGYTLTKNGPSWSSSTGFWIDPSIGSGSYQYNVTLYNNTLCTKNIQTVIFRYGNFNTEMMHPVCEAYGSNGFVRIRFGLSRSDGEPWPGTSSRDTKGYPVAPAPNGAALWGKSRITASGVFGLNIKTAMYLNGNAITVQTCAISGTDTDDYPFTSGSNPYMIWLPRGNDYRYYAWSFYDVALTAAQHKEVCDAMNSL